MDPYQNPAGLPSDWPANYHVSPHHPVRLCQWQSALRFSNSPNAQKLAQVEEGDRDDRERRLVGILATAGWDVEWRTQSGRTYAICRPPGYYHIHSRVCVGSCSEPARYVAGIDYEGWPVISDGPGRGDDPYVPTAGGSHDAYAPGAPE